LFSVVIDLCGYDGDSHLGYSCIFCVQHMSAESEARAAIAELDGSTLNGSRIHVEVCVGE